MRPDATADIVVVGSGPAGASAAWPLVAAGRDVVMLEAGGSWQWPASGDRPPLERLRGSPSAATWLFGRQLSALRHVTASTPKVRTAFSPDALATYTSANGVTTNGFTAIGVLARGGLTNIWGAGAGEFETADVRDWPITIDDLAPSYRAVTGRIGISGPPRTTCPDHLEAPTDAPVPLGALAETVLAKYAQLQARLRVELSRPRVAVITQPRDGREACARDNTCMWGCTRGAIYTAAHDVAMLARSHNFRITEDALVQSLGRSNGGWLVTARRPIAGGTFRVEARTVVLAAGVLPSTRLVLSLQGLYDTDIRLHSTPSFAGAFLSPGAIGRPLATRGAALAQLTARLPMTADDDYVFGTMFETEGLAAADVAASMPLTMNGALRMTRRLTPATLVGLFYLSSRFSDNTVRLVASPDGLGTLHVSGRRTAAASARIKQGMAAISRDLTRVGLYRLPRSLVINAPGSESHLAGTLPMGGRTSPAGEVLGAEGLFVADGSVLPSLPAKHHTLTVMANADRIGRYIAAARR